MPVTDKRVIEVVDYCLEHGDEKTVQDLEITHESLAVYKRRYKKLNNDLEVKTNLLKIQQQFSEKEIAAIANSGQVLPKRAFAPTIDFEGQRIKFGFMTDTHFGSIYFKEGLFDSAIAEMKKQGCEFIAHCGDVTEGMSNRPGHHYELEPHGLGYDRQKTYAIENLKKWDKSWFLIDGNHDRWYIKSNGAYIVKDIAEALPNVEFLGHDSGEIKLKHDVIVALRHGEDGSSYATSYRPQKFIEAIGGGYKPNIMLFGHVHKMIYMFERNIQAVSGGCIQLQTGWMASKRLIAHPGFWIIDVWVDKEGVTKFCPCWYPFYV